MIKKVEKFTKFAKKILSDDDKNVILEYIEDKDYIENKANQYFTIRGRFFGADTKYDVVEVFVNEKGLIFIFDIKYI